MPAYVAIAPVVPQITDHELERSSRRRPRPARAAASTCRSACRYEVAPLFRAWLDEHFPDRAAKVMATIQSMRGGTDNDPNFFSRMRGKGPWADLLKTRFELACKKHGLPSAKFPLRTRPVRAARRATSCGCFDCEFDGFSTNGGDSCPRR